MRWTFVFGLKEVLGAVVLSCFIAGGVGAVTNPATTRRDAPSLVSVNRIHKQDRLPPAAALTYQQPNAALSTRISSASPKRPPVGCDPAFSPVAEPARANIFRRCLT
jgi:hypothetical protein